MSISVAATDPSVIPDGFTWDDREAWCPKDLQEQYSRDALRKGSEEFDALVDGAYQIWRDNDYMPVELNPEPGSPMPLCAREGRAAVFDIELPDEEDYEGGEDDPQFEWDLFREELKTAEAKKICGDCPLAMQCLTASVTMPRITLNDRDGSHTAEVATYDTDRVETNPYGIHGGYGYKSRDLVRRAILDRQRADYYAEHGA